MIIYLFFRDNLTYTIFRILWDDSQISETTNYVTYKVQNFISDIGGLVGLFLGISLLSLFEFALKFLAIIKGCLKKLFNQEKTESKKLAFSNEIDPNILKLNEIRKILELIEECRLGNVSTEKFIKNKNIELISHG